MLPETHCSFRMNQAGDSTALANFEGAAHLLRSRNVVGDSQTYLRKTTPSNVELVNPLALATSLIESDVLLSNCLARSIWTRRISPAMDRPSAVRKRRSRDRLETDRCSRTSSTWIGRPTFALICRKAAEISGSSTLATSVVA